MPCGYVSAFNLILLVYTNVLNLQIAVVVYQFQNQSQERSNSCVGYSFCNALELFVSAALTPLIVCVALLPSCHDILMSSLGYYSRCGAIETV